ncbi:MAG: hypothetical protein ACLFM4_14230 [Phormidium sp.]
MFPRVSVGARRSLIVEMRRIPEFWGDRLDNRDNQSAICVTFY